MASRPQVRAHACVIACARGNTQAAVALLYAAHIHAREMRPWLAELVPVAPTFLPCVVWRVRVIGLVCLTRDRCCVMIARDRQ
jgi:hypothetical protein